MSKMENMQGALTEQTRQDAVYAQAMASLKNDRMRREAQGYAIMAAALGYGESALGTGMFGRISHAAKLLCIGFACAVWPFLVWWVLL